MEEGGEKEARSILQTCIQTGEQTPRTKSTEVKDGLHKQLPFCADRHALTNQGKLHAIVVRT